METTLFPFLMNQVSGLLITSGLHKSMLNHSWDDLLSQDGMKFNDLLGEG